MIFRDWKYRQIQQLIDCGCARDLVDCVDIWKNMVQSGTHSKEEAADEPANPYGQNNVLQFSCNAKVISAEIKKQTNGKRPRL